MFTNSTACVQVSASCLLHVLTRVCPKRMSVRGCSRLTSPAAPAARSAAVRPTRPSRPSECGRPCAQLAREVAFALCAFLPLSPTRSTPLCPLVCSRQRVDSIRRGSRVEAPRIHDASSTTGTPMVEAPECRAPHRAFTFNVPRRNLCPCLNCGPPPWCVSSRRRAAQVFQG